MSKKAQIFDVTLVFITLGAMIAVLFVVNTIASETSQWKTIGHRAFDLQNTYAQGDLFVGFMATAARWAAAETVRELGERGGFLAIPSCGSIKGFAYWNTPDGKTTCTPLVYENFYNLLSQKLEHYATQYPQVQKIPYEFLVTGDRLLGIPTIPVRLNIFGPKEKVVRYNPFDITALFSPGLYTERYPVVQGLTGFYVFRPNFEIPFTYNLDIYKALIDAAEEMRRICAPNDIIEEKTACVQKKLTAALAQANEQATVTVEVEDNVYYITITQQPRKSIYLGNEAPVIRFALPLPQG